MENINPVLFYFWAHGSIENTKESMIELDTLILKKLIKRANIIFKEFITDDIETVYQIEKDWNDYISNGEMSETLRLCLDGQFPDTHTLYMAELMKGTNKRFVFEKSLEAPFDLEEENKNTNRAFLEYDLDRALEIKEEFLTESENYQIEREKSVSEQILAIPDTTLVIFGAGHPELEKEVANYRITETHYPYLDYPISYETQMRHEFRKTGKINKELYLRNMMEQITIKGVKENLKGREQDLVVHYYTSLLTPEQIIECRDYIVSCSRFLLVSKQDIFESYLKKESLPSIQEVLKTINKN